MEQTSHLLSFNTRLPNFLSFQSYQRIFRVKKVDFLIEYAHRKFSALITEGVHWKKNLEFSASKYIFLSQEMKLINKSYYFLLVKHILWSTEKLSLDYDEKNYLQEIKESSCLCQKLYFFFSVMPIRTLHEWW